MRVALIGASGQLGTALSKVLSPSGVECIPLDHAAMEITDAARVAETLDCLQPAVVINCAAYNFVDKAEEEPQAAYLVNALGPRNLALACGPRDITLLHVSSDYVFGGAGVKPQGHTELDLPAPLGAYAVSKLAGEYFVRTHCPRHFIVRTCGLYGEASTPGKGNFIKTMLRLGKERGEVSVVDDQWCTPSSADDVASGIQSLIGTSEYGLYHATNSGETTWCRLAIEAFRSAGLNVRVKPITTAEFKAKAPRPPFSVLNCSKLNCLRGGHPLPSWQEGVARYVATLQFLS